MGSQFAHAYSTLDKAKAFLRGMAKNRYDTIPVIGEVVETEVNRAERNRIHKVYLREEMNSTFQKEAADV
jgi:hypothetical protein